MKIKKLPSCKRTKAIFAFAPPVTLYGPVVYYICRYMFPLTAENRPSLLLLRERNSRVIFHRNYSHQAPTLPRLSADLVPIYCLHLCFCLFKVLSMCCSIIRFCFSICQGLFGRNKGFYGDFAWI